jgi:hypothetical protein
MDVCELEIYLQNFMCIEMDCRHNLLVFNIQINETHKTK